MSVFTYDAKFVNLSSRTDSLFSSAVCDCSILLPIAVFKELIRLFKSAISCVDILLVLIFFTLDFVGAEFGDAFRLDKFVGVTFVVLFFAVVDLVSGMANTFFNFVYA